MQEGTSENNDYNYDCGSLQLAVKVGIVGVIIQYISYIVILIIYSNFFDTPEMSIGSLSYQVSFVKFLSISWVLFVSLGYLGIFRMKKNKLAALFPIMALISTAGYWIYRGILWEFVPDSGQLLTSSETLLVYIILVATCLALLTLRNKTANPKLLYTLVIIMLVNVFLISLLQSLLFGYVVVFENGIEFLIYGLPRLAIRFIISCLISAFFIIESRAGCKG
ncbi:MAG: hypothetical protein ACFFEV_09885 [Candidatus Thorarchaeota archaeon]